VLYGGHITDGMDKRCCITYLQVWERGGCALLAATCGCHLSARADTGCCRPAPAPPPPKKNQELIRPDILPSGRLDDAATWAQPPLQLAPGFPAPLPASFDGLKEHIETALPAESPVMYAMHPNAGVLLSTSLGETLFKTITEVSGGATGAAAGGGAGEAAVRAALQDYLERLPQPFVVLDIEARVQERTPYVVVALQEVR
jgi:dynein heavy chain